MNGDDDLDDCLFFKSAVAEFSLPTQLETVHDGEQLMQHLTKEQSNLPDVLFLDLNMPRMNGFECLAEIKTNKAKKSCFNLVFVEVKVKVIEVCIKKCTTY